LVSGSKARATVISPSRTSAISTFVAISSSSRTLAQLELLDLVEEFEDFLVSPVAECAEESGGQEFPAALASIQINIEQVVGVELHFQPGTAIGNDAEAVKDLAVEMDGRLEADARRAMQLRNDDALRPR
jgi:hypothetical protein